MEKAASSYTKTEAPGDKSRCHGDSIQLSTAEKTCRSASTLPSSRGQGPCLAWREDWIATLGLARESSISKPNPTSEVCLTEIAVKKWVLDFAIHLHLPVVLASTLQLSNLATLSAYRIQDNVDVLFHTGPLFINNPSRVLISSNELSLER